MEGKPAKPEYVPLNMADIYYLRLNKLIERKDYVSIMDDLPGWYQALRAIYRNIIFIVSEKENDHISSLFLKVSNLLNSKSIRETSAYVSAKRNNIRTILDDIDMKVMVIMHKNGMIFPKGRINNLDLLKQQFDIEE